MPSLTIAELVQQTDVPPATVHYYLRQGLLPKPKQPAPNRFLYDERHVRALRLIRILRERRGLPLAMIRRILPELLALETEEAFSPELWDRALAPRMGHPRLPGPRLLEAAKKAFPKHGFAEVNVDDLARAARIAKGSFYRHYPSKEELVLAFLRRREELWTRGWLEQGVERRSASPAERLLAVFDVFDRWFHRSDFEGCAFVKVLLEHDDPAHPIRKSAEAYTIALI